MCPYWLWRNDSFYELPRGSYRGGLETENREIKRPKTENQKIRFFSKIFKTENRQIRPPETKNRKITAPWNRKPRNPDSTLFLRTMNNNEENLVDLYAQKFLLHIVFEFVELNFLQIELYLKFYEL